MLKSLAFLYQERLDLLFFGAFLLSFPFNWRKIIAIYNPPGFSGFNEYTDISFVLPTFLFLISFFIFIINNKNYIKSILMNYMFHVEHIFFLYLPIFILILAFLSSFFANQKAVSFYTFIILVIFIMLYWYILFQFYVPRGTKGKSYTWNFIRFILILVCISAFFQSIIAIFQFIFQSSIGLSFLKESIFNRNMTGVAKIVLFESVYVRSYGTFLHPNVLAGYLVFSIFTALYLFQSKLFHVKQEIFILYLLILSTGLILTFSKTALFSIIFILFFSFTWNNKFKKIKNLFHVELYLIFIFILAFTFTILFQEKKFLSQSFNERIILFPIAVDILSKNPILGVGLGNFVYNLPQFISISEKWQLQPIHNIYLLILNENGILFLMIFISIIIYILKNVPYETIFGNYSFKIILLIIILGFSDHYLWDIYSGQVMLWMSLAMASGSVILTKLNNIAK